MSLFLLMQAAPPATGQAEPFVGFGYIPFALIAVIFYFMILKPQKKEKLRQAEMRSNIKKGDEVITQGGVIATVRQVKDNDLEVVLDIDDQGSRMTVLKNALSLRVSPDAAAAKGGKSGKT